MGLMKRLVEERKRARRGGRKVVLRRRGLPWQEGPYRAYAFRTRNADVLCILHLFSGRVVWTACLPVGLLADLWADALGEVTMSFLRKAVPPGNGQQRGPVPPAKMLTEYPALCEYLYGEEYPDGSRRQRSTLTLMAGDAVGVKVVLNDRDQGRSLWATGSDLEDCLLALEAMLQYDDCPWRLDKQFKKPSAK